eukprot:PITA_09445
MMEHIEDFQKLNIRVKDIPEEHRIDMFIGTLKDNIQHEVCLWEPDSLEKAFKLARKMGSKIIVTRMPTTHNYKDGCVVAPSLPQPIRVLKLLEEKQLYEESSKCFFGVQEVEYLGHILSHEGVKVEPSKIKAIKEAKIPTSIKQLRGFLRLTGYYRKFVNNYGRIVAPLTTLLNKDAFSWTLEEKKAFKHLKEAMCQAPVLSMPNFMKTFIVECDASRNGIGVVLMQDERSIALESCPINGKYLHKAIYEKETLAILHALKKW